MEEPLKLGTIIDARTCGSQGTFVRLVRTNNPNFPWSGFDNSEFKTHSWSWEALHDAVLVHEGMTPVTPEPTGWGAVVRDADGDEFSRTNPDPDYVWVDRMLALCKWQALAQPVEILFEGVE